MAVSGHNFLLLERTLRLCKRKRTVLVSVSYRTATLAAESRLLDSQSSNPGSIPGSATNSPGKSLPFEEGQISFQCFDKPSAKKSYHNRRSGFSSVNFHHACACGPRLKSFASPFLRRQSPPGGRAKRWRVVCGESGLARLGRRSRKQPLFAIGPN